MIPKKKLHLRRRPEWLPWAWVNITAAHAMRTAVRKRDLQLVLDSSSIDFIVCRFAGRDQIYVSPLLEKMARREIAAYDSENICQNSSKIQYPDYPGKWNAVLFLLPLLLFYLFCHSPAGSNMDWNALGSLDAIKIFHDHEWYRLLTALTLHANIAHVTGNIFFGAVFLSLLAGMTGCGIAFFLTIISGIIANFFSVLPQDAEYRSIGFSTALFASLGIMAGIMLWRLAEKRKIFLPLAAAMGLLAMLGVSGEHTDYPAHISGLSCGFLLGVATGPIFKRKWPASVQIGTGLAGLLLPCLAWVWALG